MSHTPVIPALWFHTETGTLSEVLTYYRNIFWSDFETKDVVPLGQTPSENAELCDVFIFGQRYSFMSTQQAHHPFNDALSLIILCKDQAEIDHYWNYFIAEGEEYNCGWCKDTFGLRWQIIPENLDELMKNPGAFDVMMSQKKIIIAEY